MGLIPERAKAQSRTVIQEDNMATLATAAVQIFPTCNHEREDYTSAFVPVGDEGFEQCIICGKVICTEPLDDEDAPGRYAL